MVSIKDVACELNANSINIFKFSFFLPLIDIMHENSPEGNKKHILKLNVISKVWRSIT